MSTYAAELVTLVEAAELDAAAEHDAGQCHLSEWSCSTCESARASG